MWSPGVRAQGMHKIWQVSPCLRNPKQGDSPAQADTTGAAVTWGRDSSPGAQLEGQGQCSSQRSLAACRGRTNNFSISLMAAGRNFTAVSGGFFKKIEPAELLPRCKYFCRAGGRIFLLSCLFCKAGTRLSIVYSTKQPRFPNTARDQGQPRIRDQATTLHSPQREFPPQQQMANAA